MNRIQRFTYGLFTALFFAPLAVAQNECGDAVIVSSGDTLSKIAERCNTSVSALLDANRQLSNGNSITAGSILAMPDGGTASYSGAQPSADGTAQVLAPEEIDELVARIALYPDVLLSEILPASTYPVEIVQAARWRKAHENAEDADKQDWAPSIKALTRYPDALNMLNDDLDWTVRLGDAFLAQPDDIFDGIQRMRTKAEAAGSLKDTEQQVIVREKTEVVEVIRIVPANPRYVYVPYYDPYDVYYPYHGARVVRHAPLISFSAGFALGGWMNYGLNWHHRHIYHHHYTPTYYRGHNRRTITRRNSGYPTVANVDHGQRWRHDANRSRRHHVRGTVRNTGGISHRNHIGERRDAGGQRAIANARYQARINRLDNMRNRGRDQQTINRTSSRTAQQQRQPAAAVRTPQTNSVRTYRSNNTDRNEIRRDRRDNPQYRNQRERNQRERNVVRTRNPQSTRAAVNRASNQTPRRAAQPRASAQPRVELQRRAAQRPQVSAPRRNTVRVSRPQTPTANSRSVSQPSQQSRPARVTSNRSERNSSSQRHDRGGNRGSSRSGRIRERHR
ncbi:MAG: DUF3300 domain-containing protein [Pseudomonadales bacterium]